MVIKAAKARKTAGKTVPAVSVMRPAGKEPAPAVDKDAPAPAVRKAPARKPAPKVPAKKKVSLVRRAASARPPAKGTPAKAALRLEKRLAGIRAASGELSKALEEVENARLAIEEAFDKATEANLARARGALETIGRVTAAGPLLDARRLERDLQALLARSEELAGLDAQGRKRDILAVDDFLGRAARRLELAVAGAAAENLKILSGRLAETQELRQKLKSAVKERFRTRVNASRATLGELATACARLDEKSLNDVSRELDRAVALGRSLPVGKLEGKPKDLYGIDGLVKQISRRLDRVRGIVAVRTEHTDG